MYAEVFAGSSQIWFIEPWSLLVTLPLYLFHTLFYLNLGFRTKRVSLKHLYLWGCLFALYEAPITKVLWTSYGGSGPIWGQFLDVSILEFLTLVFFWHPILAFVVPILVFEIFSGKVMKDHGEFLSSKWGKILLYGVVVAGSFTLGVNTQFTLTKSLGSFLGSLILIGAVLGVHKLLKRKFEIGNLELGKLGFGLVVLYLILLYVLTGILLLPQNIGTPLGILMILISALVFGVLLWKLPGSKKIKFSPSKGMMRDLIQSWGLFVVLSILWSLIPEIAGILAMIVFVLIPFIGAGIFLYTLKQFSKNITT
jgi:hypothetical protein